MGTLVLHESVGVVHWKRQILDIFILLYTTSVGTKRNLQTKSVPYHTSDLCRASDPLVHTTTTTSQKPTLKKFHPTNDVVVSLPDTPCNKMESQPEIPPPLRYIVIPKKSRRFSQSRDDDARSNLNSHKESYATLLPREDTIEFADSSELSEELPLVILSPSFSFPSTSINDDIEIAVWDSTGHETRDPPTGECDSDSFCTLSTKDSGETAGTNKWEGEHKNSSFDTGSLTMTDSNSHSYNNTTITTSPKEAFESGDESYFTQGFVNVGELPTVC